jgi:hypothetical protein
MHRRKLAADADAREERTAQSVFAKDRVGAIHDQFGLGELTTEGSRAPAVDFTPYAP